MLAVEHTKRDFEEQLHGEIDLLATCISESTFTSDIVDALQLKTCDRSFQRLMKEHLADEGRHYSFFKVVLKHFTERASREQKEAAIPIVARLLGELFQGGQESDFDKALLVFVGVDANEAVRILRQTRQSKSSLLRAKRASDFFGSAGLPVGDGVDEAAGDRPHTQSDLVCL
jgi:hypothetical protein